MARSRGLEFRGFTAPFDAPKRLSGTLLEQVFEASRDVDLVIIKGGEPTLEPLFFEFMERLKERGGTRAPSVFLQTNGTRRPSHWLARVGGLELDVGVSLDGWEDTYEWIRGTSFSSVLANIEALDAAAQVKSLTIDFTLSYFNCLHLPRFLREVLAIRERLPKLRHCPVFQWAHQEYASPLALGLGDRMRVLREVEPILRAHGDFFLDHRALLKVLSMPQLPVPAVARAVRWLDFMNEKRGRSLPDDASIRSSSGDGTHV